MSEDYKSFLLGVCAGFLTLIFLQISIFTLGLRKVVNKKKYTDTYHKDIFEDPPAELVSLLSIATRECTDLAWLNVSLQRFFYELSKSSTFYEKVKATMVKKLSIAFSSGLLKRIRFKDVSFGSEAPYIKSIKALSEDEIEELMGRKENEENQNKPAYFKQVYLLINIDYTASDNCIYIDADLIKGYSIPIMVKMQPFRGDLVLRMPANNYSTRFEISFVRNPGFDFSVDASFSKNDSAFFSNTLSHVIKRVCKYVVKMYVFPNWYYYYLPMVVSRSKVIQYSYYPIIGESIDGPMHQVREVQNLFSLDYSILAKKGNIIFRKTKSTVNTSNTAMERAEIEILNRQTIINELFTPGSSIDIFSDVISDYEGTKIIQKYSAGVTKVHIIIANGIYEFIRVVVDDLIIFQRTDPKEPQFIALKKDLECITILQYVNTTEPFYLGRFRITKLAKKLERQEMKVLGSTKLFKFLDYSVKQAEKTKKMFKTKEKLKPENTEAEIAENFTKDRTKEKYVTDGYLAPVSSSISEVSIIESHFKTIETQLESSDLENYRIDLPYSEKDLKTALEDSLIRSSVLGAFSIMEDILLTDSIRNTSMAHYLSGQYVQLLSYSSQNSSLIIERILLSEEYQGVTAAIKIFNGYLEIFIFGSETPRQFQIFTELIVSALERNRILNLPRDIARKNYTESIINSSGFVLSSDIPVICSVSIEIENHFLFNEEIVLKSPFIFTFFNGAEVPVKVSLKPKKKSKLEIAIIPYNTINTAETKTEQKTKPEEELSDQSSTTSDDNNITEEIQNLLKTAEKEAEKEEPERSKEYLYIEGSIVVKKKGKVEFFDGTGLIYWYSPWSTNEKIKSEENEHLINGSGYVESEELVSPVWKNTENKDVAKNFRVGFVSK